MMRFTNIVCALAFALSVPSHLLAEEKGDSAMVEHLLAAGDTTTLFYARRLSGLPYVAHTLEVNDREQLVVNLRQMDCTTLVETVCALTLCARKGLGDYRSFCRFLQQLRYREGRIDGYPSRLHYFSDWIDDNVRMGLVSDVSEAGESVDDGSIAGQSPFTAVQTLRVNYMSTHPTAYKALRRSPNLVKHIQSQEKRLSGSKHRYVPKQQVDGNEVLRKVVRDGDIIAITCSKPGLDIAHLGFAVWRSDGLHLLNASQLHKKVVEEPMTLGEYLSRHPSHTGIRVVRLR